MIAIVDYGAGNLYSVQNALNYIGVSNIITNIKEDLINADSVILPGVGAFPKAMKMLERSDLISTIKQCAMEKPFLGICLGMQLLFDYSLEFEKTEGLSLINGYVDKIKTEFKIPHMGYNELEFNISSPLLNGIKEKDCVYFVHSFMANTESVNVVAYCDYSAKIPALVQKGNVFGAQFHPEKSGEVGLEILKNFTQL